MMRIAMMAFGLLLALGMAAASVTLVKDGVAKTAIFVPAAVMDPARKEHDRLRASVNDLAVCLGKMSGAKIDIVAAEPGKGDKRLPILVGQFAVARFGPFKPSSEYGSYWRLIVSRRGIGLEGESDEAISYAVYEILDRLGCRWFLPGELGESIPSRKTIDLPEMDLLETPEMLGRCIGPIDADFQRRNRCGGLAIECNDIAISMRTYVSKEKLAAHPAWNAELDGKREVSGLYCWSNLQVADAVADGIVARLDKAYQPVVTLSQPYNSRFCECAACRALDAGGWCKNLDRPSMTDRYVAFANRVAERVTKKYPRVLFGMLMNASYVDPPLREKPHPNLLPVVTSVNFCRAHALDDPICPNRRQFRTILDGWGKLTRRFAVYEFGYNLAEVSAPYPMLRWAKDIPVFYASGSRFWLPYGWVSDIMPNLESALPGMYLGIRMSWYPQAKPAQVLDEFYTRFYGAASGPMRRYWQIVDDAWEKTPEHAGYFFGFDRRFTPDVLAQARQALNDALAGAKTAPEYRRVKLAEDCFQKLELFMAMRRNLVAGRLAALEKDANYWLAFHEVMGKAYAGSFAFVPYGAAALPAETYRDAARIARDGQPLTPPIAPWRYKVEKGNAAAAGDRWAPGFDDAAWPVTDPCTESWSSLGLFTFYGTVWYRASVKVPAVPPGKKVYLWVSMVDDACRLYLNGKAVPYVNDIGETSATAVGYMMPFSFDVTWAVKPGEANQLTIAGTRSTLNELGTGGLMGPVLFYREK